MKRRAQSASRRRPSLSRSLVIALSAAIASKKLREQAFRGRLNDSCPICRAPLEDAAEKAFHEATVLMICSGRLHDAFERGEPTPLAGASQSARRDMQAIRTALERALKLDENHFGANITLGEILAEDPDRAEKLLRKAIAIDDSEPSAYLALGGILEARGNRSGAMKEYKHAITWATCKGGGSSLAAGHMKLAILHEEDGNLPAAVQAYEAAAVANPLDYLVPFNLGVALEETDTEGTIVAFKKALALKPGFYTTNYALANAYKRRLIEGAHDNSSIGQQKRAYDGQLWLGATLRAKALAVTREHREDCEDHIQNIRQHLPSVWRVYQVRGEATMAAIV